MCGPQSGPRRRKLVIALAAAAAVITFHTTNISSAAAQGRSVDSEALIGTFETDAGREDRFASPTNDVPDDALSRIYANALEDLEDGQLAAAQAAFESVIARDPRGHLADESRRHLAALYRRASSTDAPQPEPSARSSLGASDVMPTTVSPPKPRIEAAKLGHGVSQAVEETFISDAGDRIFFAEGSAEIGLRARIVLAAQARWLASRPELNAVIEGHADERGMPPDKQTALSNERASVVRDRLIEEGIAETRLAIAGQGRLQPISDCPKTECAVQNRRVVTVLKSHARDFGSRTVRPAVTAERNRETQ